jgi:hypothetical protein
VVETGFRLTPLSPWASFQRETTSMDMTKGRLAFRPCLAGIVCKVRVGKNQ